MTQNNSNTRPLQIGAFAAYKEAERAGDKTRMAEVVTLAERRPRKPLDPVLHAIEHAKRYTLADFEGAGPAPHPGEMVEQIVELRHANRGLTDQEVASAIRVHWRKRCETRLTEIEADTTMSDDDKAESARWARESVAQYQDAPERSRFAVIEADEFAGAEHVEPEWLVSEVLPRRGLAMIWGESGAGKSFFALDLAAAISRGVKWRDRPVTKGRAVIVVAEGEHSFGLRLKAYAAKHGVSLADMPAVIPAAPNLSLKSDVKELIGALKRSGAQFVAFDTLSMCATSVDENSAQQMGQVVSLAKSIYRELDACVCLIHHSGKDTTRGARGSSVLRPAMDLEILVEGDGETGEAKIEKLKDAARGARFPFKLEFVQLGVSQKSGKPFGSLCVEPTESSYKGSPLSPNSAAILAKARELLKGRESMPLKELAESCRTVIEVLPKNYTRTFKRAVSELTTRGGLVKDGESVKLRVIELSPDEFD